MHDENDDNDDDVTERPGRVGALFRSWVQISAPGTCHPDRGFLYFLSTCPGKCVQNISNFSASIRVIPRSLYTNNHFMCVISGFHRDVDGICALLCFYAAYIGNYFTDLRDNLSVSSTRVPWIFWPLKMGPLGCPETSVMNYHSALRNIPEERRSHRIILHHKI